MTIAVTDILDMMQAFLWPFLRLSALLFAAPILGARTVPVRIRIVLGVVLTILVQPLLPAMPDIAPISAAGFITAVQQIAIGTVMGMTLQIMFSAFVMAGMITATTMGLSFASTVDPQNGIQVPMIGQLYLILGTLMFLGLDGHLLLIELLAASFTFLPIGAQLLSPDLFFSIGLFGSQMFLAAVMIALPATMGVLLVNLGLGVVTRAAPQLNIFSVGFPVTILSGFILILLSMPLLSGVFADLSAQAFDLMQMMAN
ncbi:MAG: flagellar biosynthetic protein FliR [Pseudomonadales bacterium]|nr:flagellar biosynthetic protein FliR [Pseudomonadales bacterium]